VKNSAATSAENHRKNPRGGNIDFLQNAAVGDSFICDFHPRQLRIRSGASLAIRVSFLNLIKPFCEIC